MSGTCQLATIGDFFIAEISSGRRQNFVLQIQVDIVFQKVTILAVILDF